MSSLGEPDWARLESLRERFLVDDPRPRTLPDYWSCDADLEAYDAVFAQRIGWKWQAVLDELHDRCGERSNTVDGLAEATVLDWGCGTGIASRRFLASGSENPRELILHDRSDRAMDFASRRVRAVHPDVAIRSAAMLDPDMRPDVLLISHALSELAPRDEAALVDLASRSGVVLWVESGNHQASRRLSAIRDRLVDRFEVLAPCTHREPCSALASGEQHWCHFFAPPPPDVFTDSNWVKIGKRLGIDLRSLPYSFVALRTRTDAPANDESQMARIVGRPHVRPKLARYFACDSSGLRETKVFRSASPDVYRSLKKSTTKFRCFPAGE